MVYNVVQCPARSPVHRQRSLRLPGEVMLVSRTQARTLGMFYLACAGADSWARNERLSLAALVLLRSTGSAVQCHPFGASHALMCGYRVNHSSCQRGRHEALPSHSQWLVGGRRRPLECLRRLGLCYRLAQTEREVSNGRRRASSWTKATVPRIHKRRLRRCYEGYADGL